MKTLRIKFEYADNAIVQADATATFGNFDNSKVSEIVGSFSGERLEFLVKLFAQYAEGNITPASIPETIKLSKL